jgi:ketosteroid isomerase-like protein
MDEKQRNALHTELAREFIQCITKGCAPDDQADSALDRAEAMISADYQYQLLPKSLGHQPLKWPEHRKWLAENIRNSGFHKFRIDVQQSTAEGDRVVLEATSFAIAGDGREYSNQYRFTISFNEDDKICREVEFLDSLYVATFIGKSDIGVQDSH